MVKADLSRDYYADLDLPPTADIADIKKQFRKLALRYHPDRNPGNEAEVNSKFQIIQSAHEVLTNAEQKSRYDSHRARTRYPAASGVRGNPWQDAGSQYPPPPKRPPPPGTRPAASSGASRYSGWAPPPHRSSSTRENDYMRSWAWDRMRPSSGSKPAQNQQQQGPAPTSQFKTRRSARAADPPPAPPRTESQRKKAEASFGARKAPFVHVEDEPPVASRNYATTRQHTNLFGTGPAAAEPPPPPPRPRPRPDDIETPNRHFRESFMDKRQSTPYSSQGGEKTNPFDGVDFGGARGSDDDGRTGRGTTAADPPRRRRSLSVPTSESENARRAARDGGGGTGGGGSSNFRRETNFSFASRAGERYRPREDAHAQQASASAPFTTPRSSTSSLNSAQATVDGNTAPKSKDGGPSVYATPNITSSSSHPSASFASSAAPRTAHPLHSIHRADEGGRWTGGYGSHAAVKPSSRPAQAAPPPSGDYRQGRGGEDLNAFESRQYQTLRFLISNKSAGAGNVGATKASSSCPPDNDDRNNAQKHADQFPSSSFTFPLGDDAFDRSAPPKRDRFMRNSSDNINTRFVAEDFTGSDWQFQAGGPSEDAFLSSRRQGRSKTRHGRQGGSPTKGGGGGGGSGLRFGRHTTSSDPQLGESGSGSGQRQQQRDGFNPEHWSEKIGPQNFAPQPGQSAAAATGSPTRHGRSKKSKPVRMTAGNAGLVDEDDSSGEERAQFATVDSDDGDTRGAAPFATDSPSAMDIDTPPPPTETVPPKPAGTARKIPVEPSRPEWRAGNANGTRPEPSNPTAGLGTTPAADNSRGSEDTDGFFRPGLFADFKNVPPFAPHPASHGVGGGGSGLGSLDDLKADLPFESKPSTKLPTFDDHQQQQQQHGPIVFPSPPKPPHPPPALAVPNLKASAVSWKKYVHEFHAYMVQWTAFSARFAEHFDTRRRLVEQNREATNFGWIESRGDAGILEYLDSLEADRLVRQKWMAACDAHEVRVREFVKCRDKMMQQSV